MIKIGVVGSRNYKNVGMVHTFVKKFCLLPIQICFISGGCPNSPDQDAKEQVEAHNKDYADKIDFKEYLPETKDRDGFFARNKLIAEESDFLLAFIPKNQLKSGAWNTIKWMKQKKSQNSYIVVDENGERWDKCS